MILFVKANILSLLKKWVKTPKHVTQHTDSTLWTAAAGKLENILKQHFLIPYNTKCNYLQKKIRIRQLLTKVGEGEALNTNTIYTTLYYQH